MQMQRKGKRKIRYRAKEDEHLQMHRKKEEEGK
jgi:hypothetical protein